MTKQVYHKIHYDTYDKSCQPQVCQSRFVRAAKDIVWNTCAEHLCRYATNIDNLFQAHAND